MNDANEPTRVLIADDHPVMRDGLRDMVEQQPDMEVVGEATNGIEAIAEYRRIKPDVILMDLQMPELDGLEAISIICQDTEAERLPARRDRVSARRLA